MHFLARFGNETDRGACLWLLSRPKELAQHLRVVDEINRRFAEFGSAAREARARPVEIAVLECKSSADGAWSVLDGELLALDVEVGRHVAAVDAQKLATVDVVLASFGRIGRRAAVQRYPRAAGEICTSSKRICSRIWLDLEDECCAAVVVGVVVRDWDHSGC